MWKFILDILTNTSLLIPIIGLIIVFINSRDKRVKELTILKIELENFDKKYSPVYKNILREVEVASDSELEKIGKVEIEIKTCEKDGRERLKFFLIFLFIYLLFILSLK